VSRFVPQKTDRTSIRLPADKGGGAAGPAGAHQLRGGQAVPAERAMRWGLYPAWRPFLTRPGKPTLRVMLYEGCPADGGRGWSEVLARPARPRNAWGLIGPEGGFTEAEAARRPGRRH
jgi:hypothetical protein